MILNRVVPAGGIINDILQGNAVEVVVYRLVESLPHGQGDTLGGARTLVYGILEAAHGQRLPSVTRSISPTVYWSGFFDSA